MKEGEFKKRAVWVHPDEIRDHKVEEESRGFVALKNIDAARKDFEAIYSREKVLGPLPENETYYLERYRKATAEVAKVEEETMGKRYSEATTVILPTLEWFLKWFGDIKK
jgi:hypothetical protein